MPRTLIHDLYGEYYRFECVHTYNHRNMNIKEMKKNFKGTTKQEGIVSGNWACKKN